jgi:hypothetical protein
MRFTVRVREFETVQVEVAADASHFDLGIDDEQLANIGEGKQLRTRLRELVETEVKNLATEELARISALSDFSPNLADDYLGSIDGDNKKNHPTSEPSRRLQDHPPSSRRLRR